jgi:hypothetical protein
MKHAVGHKYEFVSSELYSHTIIDVLPDQNCLIEPANAIMEMSRDSNTSTPSMGERQEVTGNRR